MSNWNASDNGLNGIRESLYRIAGYLERKEERETAIKDAPVERDLENTHSTREPLIKDEKVRKAVRAWAEALDFKNDEHIILTKPEYHARVLDVEKGLFTMSIPYDEENIEDVCNLPYTIAELCGEEE